MDSRVADVLCKALDEAYYKYHRHDSYSGRGMYGRATVGISVPRLGHFLEAIAAAAIAVDHAFGEGRSGTLDPDDFLEHCRKIQIDSLGTDTIFY